MDPATIGLAAAGAVVAVVGVALFRAMPRVAVVVWTLVLFFVPVWIGVEVGFFWAATTLATLAAIAANLDRLRFAAPDLAVLAFVVSGVGMHVLGEVGLSSLIIALLEWITPYVWGRVVLSRVRGSFVFRAIAVCAVVAAALALVEVATGRNAFVELPAFGEAAATWTPLQYRAGLLRAEGAFGHSIALGAVLAMSTAFVLASRWRTGPTLAALVLVAGAVTLTLSRTAMASAVITIALGLLLLQRMRGATRLLVVAAGVVGAVVVVPIVSSVFLDAGSEASGSAAYRGDLLGILPELSWLGGLADWSAVTDGGIYLGTFAPSVDNALLLVAIRFGLLPALLLLALVVAAALSLLDRPRVNPATIALVGQVPALFSVAFITQYGPFLWFVGGLAVSLAITHREGADGLPAAFREPAVMAPPLARRDALTRR